MGAVQRTAVSVAGVAALLLAVFAPPPSFAADAAGPLAATAVTAAAAGPSRVLQDGHVTVRGRLLHDPGSGTLVPEAAAPLRVEFQAAGTSGWTVVRVGRTDARGAVAAVLVARRSGSWRLAFAGSSTQSASVGAARFVDVSEVTHRVFGHSVRGRALTVYVIGHPSAPHRVLVVGCIHGNECAGTGVVARLRTRVPPVGVVYYLVVTCNPDGRALHTRQNARGVDLNRNFPYRWHANGARWGTYYPGPRALSEPETRAMYALIRRVQPTFTVWYHQHMNVVDFAAGRLAVARRYAGVAHMHVTVLPRLSGSASTWQRRAWPGHSVLIVELPARPSRALIVRSTEAVGRAAVL